MIFNPNISKIISKIARWLWDLFINLRLLIAQHKRQHFYGRKPATPALRNNIRRQPKPEWVKQEVIRLKAFMPDAGCRKIADTFNRLHQTKKQMTVGKTYVYNTLLKHQYDVKVLRRKIKQHIPWPLSQNRVWSLDLTQVRDSNDQTHTVLGIIDAGTRACLKLQRLTDKTGITILRHLLDAIECYGKPRSIRTDNEAVFTSRLMRFSLRYLNIKHQRTERCCPWQNGKIERLFGTLKDKLKHYKALHTTTLEQDLAQFRLWYNHIRTHQYLNGCTPAEAWNRQAPNIRGKHIRFNTWGGALTGYYLSPI